MHIEWIHEDDEGNELIEQIPAVWKICSTCEGHGSHSRDFGAITSDEWNGPDWDDESRETYLSGGYDKSCEDCKGSGKVMIPDESTTEPELYQRYMEWLSERAHQRYIEKRERDMGY